MTKIDPKKLLANVDIVDVIGKYIVLKKEGAEYVGICPFHDDSKASLKVNQKKQIFKCFACDAGGDAIAFLVKRGATFKEACDEISGGTVSYEENLEKNVAKASKPVTQEWKQILLAPPLKNPIKHYKHGEPSRVWIYDDPTGKIMFYLCRFDLPSGKEVLPYTYCTNGTKNEWRWRGPDKPRPLYHLSDIYIRSVSPVLIVEGEKAADAAALLFPHLVVTCWVGGTENVKNTDWSPLNGRDIILWPDNDTEQKYGKSHAKAGEIKPFEEQPGNSAMLEIFDIVSPTANSVKFVRNPPEAPHKWDIADATWSMFEANEYLNSNIVDRELFLGITKQLDGVIKKNSDDQEYTIDIDTGEVEVVDPFKGWSREKRTDYDRVVIVVKRIQQAEKDITAEYDDYQVIGKCMAIFTEAGRELFHKICEFSPEYREKQCNSDFDKFIKDNKFTSPTRFYTICKAYDIDVKVVKTIQSAVAEGAIDAGYQDMTFEMPDKCTLTADLRTHTFTYSFIEFNSQYYYADFDFSKRKVSFFPISNFIIRPLFLIRNNSIEESRRIVEIENMYGASRVLEIPTKAFISMNEFSAFVESQGNFLFDGNRNNFQKIKAKLYNESLNSEEVRILGWHRDGFYAFANGIYTPEKFEATDDNGIVTFKEKSYFISALSSIYKDDEEEMQSNKKFKFIKNTIKFNDWADLFCRVHKENGRISLAYFITALFRDIIFNHFKFFPHLFLFGPPGTGKSVTAWSLSSMFGEPQTPFNITGGTKVAFHKKFAVFRNALVWFDEYSNSIDIMRVQALKAAYDGTGHEKSEMTTANRTKTTPVNSACVISGQELPIADNALFKRVQLCQYSQTEYTQEERDLFNKLKKMEGSGLSHITGHITTLRPIVEEKFFTEFDKTLREFKTDLASKGDIEARIIDNWVITVTMFRILEDKLPFPFSYGALREVAMEKIVSQNNLISNAKETSMFWELVEYMLDRGDIKENTDFKITNQNEIKITAGKDQVVKKFVSSTGQIETKRVFYLRLSRIHGLYMEAHRRQFNRNGMDRSSLIHYLSNTKGYIGNVHSTRFDNANSSAFAFDYDYLFAQGHNLERGGSLVDPEAEEKPVAVGAGVSGSSGSLKFNNSNPDADDLPF